MARHDDADTTPALPPVLAEFHNRPTKEVWASLNRLPLFMTDYDDTDGAGGENVELEALKALAYEGPPLEVAGNFREQGNECFREKKWKDAAEFYTNGLTVLLDARKNGQSEERNAQKSDAGIAGEEEQQMLKLQEALLLNRAACNLELQNYRRVINDCASAVRLPTHAPPAKAYYRTAVALLALSRIDEAEQALTHAFVLAPASDPSLNRLRQEVDRRRKRLEEEARQIKAREDKLQAEQKALEIAIRSRGWTIIGSNVEPQSRSRSLTETLAAVDLEDAKISLSDAKDPSSVLHFPLLILYPLAAQTDFIKSVAETDTLGTQLELVLPVPWERPPATDKKDDSTRGQQQLEREYARAEDVDCFMETIEPPSREAGVGLGRKNSKGLIKVGKKLQIGTVLSRLQKKQQATSSPQTARRAEQHTNVRTNGDAQSTKVVVIEDGLVRVYVVPKRRAKEFLDEWKKRHT